MPSSRGAENSNSSNFIKGYETSFTFMAFFLSSPTVFMACQKISRRQPMVVCSVVVATNPGGARGRTKIVPMVGSTLSDTSMRTPNAAAV